MTMLLKLSPLSWNSMSFSFSFSMFSLVYSHLFEIPNFPPNLLNQWTSEVVQSCDSMDYSLLVSSIHGVFQARVLQWVAISSSRVSSQPRDHTQLFRIIGRHLLLKSPFPSYKNYFKKYYILTLCNSSPQTLPWTHHNLASLHITPVKQSC